MCGDRRTHTSTRHLSTWFEIMAEKVFSNLREIRLIRSNYIKKDTLLFVVDPHKKMSSVFGTGRIL